MDEQFLALAQFSSFLRLSRGKWAGVLELLYAAHVQVANAGYMDFGALSQIGSPDVAVDGDGSVAFAVALTNLFSGCEILESIDEHIGMGVAKYERPELHDADETREVHDLGVRISAVEDPGEVEHLRAGVNLCPEPLFQCLFGILEHGGFLDEVEVSQDTDDFGKPVRLQDIEELESFLGRTLAKYARAMVSRAHHFETKGAVNE